jgi:serpin B
MSSRFVLSSTLSLAIAIVPACGGDDHPKPGSQPRDDGGVEDTDQDGGLEDAGQDLRPFDQAMSKLKREAAPEVSSSTFEQFGHDSRALALDMYHQLRSEPGNLFFSPYSISSALAMAYAGARGQTASEMQTALHFSLAAEELHRSFNKTDLALASRGETSEGDSKTFELAVANAVWAEQEDFGLQPAFLDLLALNYGAGVNLLDFAHEPDPSRMIINAWVSKQTHDRIRDLLPERSITTSTRLVLTNAAFFKARWQAGFAKDATQEGTFHGLEADLAVPMMRTTLDTSYAKGPGWEAALLPYSAPELAMLLIVPEQGEFDAFESSLDSTKLDSVLAALTEQYRVDLQMPRFTFESAFDLGGQLKKLGMVSAFDDNTADFSGINGKPGLVITKVVHKSFIAVDEEGTEAAAATAVVVGETSSIPVEPPPATLHVDRPFVFAIYDRPTGQLLFLGRVVAPKP